MKAAWVRPGGGSWPDEKKMARYGINQLFYDPDDPQVTAAHFDALRAHGYRPGIMRGPNGSSIALAQKLGAPRITSLPVDDPRQSDLVRLDSENKTCTVMADIEALWSRGSQYVLDFLSYWRGLRPARATIWTTEPNQGGIITDDLVNRINLDPNLLVVPQLYYSDMADVVESRCVLDLAKRRINPDRIYPFYDAEDMPSVWDGIIFDFNLLP